MAHYNTSTRNINSATRARYETLSPLIVIEIVIKSSVRQEFQFDEGLIGRMFHRQ